MKKPRIIRFKVNNFLRNSAFFLIIAGFFIFSIQPVEAAKVIKIGETKADDDIIKIEGKIGINTSSPYSLLEIASSTKYEGLRIISAASYTPFVIRNSANNADLFRIDQQGNITATGGVFGSNTDNYWKLNGSNLYSSSTSWNVGIGTTGPNAKLDVVGTGVFGSLATSRGAYGSGLSLQNNSGATTSLFLWQSGSASGHLGFSASSNLLRIVNSTYDGLITNPASIVLTNIGRVGIGTTNPVSKLSISSPDSASTAAISLNGAGSYGSGFLAIWGNYGRLSQQSSGMNNISWGAYHDGNNWVRSYSGAVPGLVNLQIGNGNYFSIQTDSQSNPAVPSFTDVLTVKGTNVGIGTANPSSVPGLDVVSGTGYSIYAGSKKIGNVASPSAITDAANKDYVDSAIAGFFAAPDLSLTQYNQYYYMQFGSITIPSGQTRLAGSWVVALYGFEIPSDYDKLGYLKINIRRDASNNASYSASIDNFGSKKVDPIYITTDDGVNYKLYIKVETKTSYSGYYKFKLIQQTQDPLVLASGTHITTNTAPSGTKYTWTATETSATFAGTTNYVPKFNSAGSLTNSIIFDNGTNVGIGTNAPGASLEVNKNQNSLTLAGVKNTNTGTSARSGIIVGEDFSQKNFIIQYLNSGWSPTTSQRANGAQIYANALATGGIDIATQNASAFITLTTGGLTTANERMRITGAGDIGIGTTNPETRLSLQNSTYRQLSLKGGSGDQTLNLGSVESSVGSYIYNNAYYSSSNTYLPSKTSASGMQMRNDGSIDFLTNTGLTIGTAYTPTSRIKILSNGNVGIGTTNPLAKLTIRHAQNNVVSGSFAVPHLKLENSATTDFTGFTGISYGLSTLDNYGWTSGALRTEAGASPAAFIWRFHSNSTVGSELVRIKSDGNVGIGTTNPQKRLDLGGGTNGRIYGIDTSTSAIFTDSEVVPKKWIVDNFAPAVGGASLWATSSTGTYNVGLGSIGVGITNPEGRLHVQGMNSAFPATSGTAQTGLVARFQPFDSNGVLDVGVNSGSGAWLQATNRTSLGSNYNLLLNPNGGNVGIGTTTPAARLQVNPSTGIEGVRIITSNDSPFVIRNSANSQNIFRVSQTGWTSIPSGLETSYMSVNSIYMPTSYGVYLGNNGYYSSNEFGIVEDGYGYNLITQDYDNDRLYVGNAITEVKSTGNIGIGTISPDQKLSISGTSVSGESSQSNISVFATNGLRINGSLGNAAQDAITYQSGGGGGSAIAFGRGGGYDTFISFYTNITSALGAISERMRIAASGNVGIGTTNPLDKLHVAGSVRINDLLNCSGTGSAVKTDASGRLVCGTVSGGITGSGSSNYVSKWTGAGTQGNSLIYDNGTNVGIGTASPSQKLDVSGVITASTGFRVNNGATSGQYLRGNGTNFVSSAIQASDVPTLNQNTSGYASLLNYEDNRTILPSELSANRMKFGFTSYNNNNSSPYADFLHFRSYQDASGGSDNLLVINKTGLGMRLYQQAWGSATAYSTFKDVLLSDNSPTVNYLTRYTGVGNNVSVGKSIIYDNGSNTGVGTNNPGYKLEVVGEVGSIGVNKGFRVSSTSGDNTNSAPWYGLGQSTQNLWSGQSWGSVQLAGYAGLNFKTASGSMVITGDTGYVGIGTTNPSRKLTVYGTHDNTSMRLHAETGQSGAHQNSILSLWASEPSTSYAGAGIGENVNGYPSYGVVNSARMGALIRFYYGSTIIERMSTSGSRTESMIINSNGDVGIGTTNPGYKLDVNGSVGAQSFTYNSDARLKKNIKTIKNPLGKILSLRGVTFNWKDSGDASVGLIAQEVEKVFPELVNGNDIKGVEYGNLVAPLIEAVKEQQRMIDKLEARIDILEKKSNTK